MENKSDSKSEKINIEKDNSNNDIESLFACVNANFLEEKKNISGSKDDGFTFGINEDSLYPNSFLDKSKKGENNNINNELIKDNINNIDNENNNNINNEINNEINNDINNGIKSIDMSNNIDSDIIKNKESNLINNYNNDISDVINFDINNIITNDKKIIDKNNNNNINDSINNDISNDKKRIDIKKNNVINDDINNDINIDINNDLNNDVNKHINNEINNNKIIFDVNNVIKNEYIDEYNTKNNITNIKICEYNNKLKIFDHKEDDSLDDKNEDDKKYEINKFTISKKNKNKEKNNSLSEEIEKSYSKILEEINKIKEELINYKEDYFKDENNYLLPDINIIKKYPIVLLNANEKEKYIKEDNHNNDNMEKQLRLLLKNSSVLEKIKLEIDNYKNSFENFLKFFGDIPFFTTFSYIDTLTLNNININEKKNEKFEFIKNSFFGDFDYFINLLYKYKRVENDNDLKKIVENLIEMKRHFNVYKSSNTINDYVLFYRKVLNDGNSFFRAFIFSLIEGYILNNNPFFSNFIRMMKIISEHYKKVISKTINKGYNRCITRLEEILHYLKNDKIQNALELFYNSFSLKNNYYDKCLIIFIKFMLYYSKKKDLDDFNHQLIDFEFYDLILLPYIFNVSIEVAFEIKLGKNEFIIFDTYNSKKNKQKIQLCFYKNNTFIYYNIDQYTKFLNYNIIKQNENLPKINKIIYKLEDKIKCSNCNKKSTHIAFIEKSILICEFCLNEYIDNIIDNRINSIVNNNLYGDSLFKNIILPNDENLEDYEYMHLYNESFMETFHRKFKEYINIKKFWICSKCKRILPNIKKLNCGCYYCRGCLDKIIKKMTNEYILLNKYEKKFIGKVRCLCGNNMDIISVINDEEKNNKNINLYESMVERFNQYIKTLCMNCEIKLSDCNDGKINVIGNKNKIINENHVLCKKCMTSLKIRENNKNVFCKICSENHNISIDI